MANMTNTTEKELVDGFTGVTQYTTPAIVYLALFTADPTETGDVTNEVSGVGYARVSLAGKFTASTDGSSSNTSAITFATAGVGGWGTVTHIGFMKSGVSATDDMVLHGALTTSIAIAESVVVEYLDGNLTVVLT